MARLDCVVTGRGYGAGTSTRFCNFYETSPAAQGLSRACCHHSRSTSPLLGCRIPSWAFRKNKFPGFQKVSWFPKGRGRKLVLETREPHTGAENVLVVFGSHCETTRCPNALHFRGKMVFFYPGQNSDPGHNARPTGSLACMT